MFHISIDDVPVVKTKVCEALSILNDGAQRADLPVELGNGIEALTVSGYWVNDVMRIDIKIKK